MHEIVLLGNPNVGKTTLFNNLTKSDEHTGNWHGVTVDNKSKAYKYKNTVFKIVDLPGVYSLTPFSFEEEVTVNYLYNNDCVVLNIVDNNSINKNLFLTMELLRAKIPCFLVINKTNKNKHINIKKLQNKLGIKIFEIDAKNKKDVDILKKQIYDISFYFKEFNSNLFVNIKSNSDILEINKIINSNAEKINVDNYYICQKILENDEFLIKKLNLSNNQKKQLFTYQQNCNLEQIISDTYKQIESVLAGVVNENHQPKQLILDKIVLNKYLSIPIFCMVLLCVFYFTFFSFGSFLSKSLSCFFHNIFGTSVLKIVESITSNKIVFSFFSEAIIGGIGSVFSFLPQVVILFICLGVLEDSGYLSRVAFCLDDIFSKVGLSGKSVYTLLMGFGCSTSACMTARTVEYKNSKIKTAMLAPYMSCSAKLPIYVVIGSAFFGASNVFVIFALYILGVVVALLLSIFYEKTFLPSKEQSFILEFPNYKRIGAERLVSIAFSNTKMFLIRVGTVLISVNVIVWLLSNFSFSFSFVQFSGEKNMLETMGRIIAPIFYPLGFGNWGACSCLIAGLVAKEVIVSSIAMINGVQNVGDYFNQKISQSLSNPASVICFNPASAISYMVFCLLYSPCLATISVLKNEIGKKWMFIAICVQLLIAYVVSLILYCSVSLILNKGVFVFIVVAALFLVFGGCLFWLFGKKKLNGCKNCFYCKNK